MHPIGEPLMRFRDETGKAEWRFHLGCGDVVEMPGGPEATYTTCPLHGLQKVVDRAPIRDVPTP